MSPSLIFNAGCGRKLKIIFLAGLNGGGGETPSKDSPLKDSSSLPFPKKKKRTPIEKTLPLLENGHIAVETATILGVEEQGARREAAKKSSTPVKIRSYKRNIAVKVLFWGGPTKPAFKSAIPQRRRIGSIRQDCVMFGSWMRFRSRVKDWIRIRSRSALD